MSLLETESLVACNEVWVPRCTVAQDLVYPVLPLSSRTCKKLAYVYKVVDPASSLHGEYNAPA